MPFHNRADLAAMSVRKLLESGFPLEDILLVDDGSDDEQRVALESSVPGLAVHSQINRGFGSAANVGINRAIADGYRFTFILNTDTLTSAAVIHHLADYLSRDDNARVAACGPTIVCDGEIHFSGGIVSRTNWNARHLTEPRQDATQAAPPDTPVFVTGCALMCRNAALRDVGMFDERFFMYWEDCDLCLRFTAAAWKLAVLPEVTIEHVVGGTTGQADGVFCTYYYNRNRFLMWWRYDRSFDSLINVISELTLSLESKSLHALTARQLALAQAMWHGLRNVGGKRRIVSDVSGLALRRMATRWTYWAGRALCYLAYQ